MIKNYMITQEEIDKASEEHDRKTPIKDLTTDKLFKAGIKWTLEKLNSKIEEIQLKEIEYLNNPVLTPVSQIINAYLSGVSDSFDVSKITRFEVIDHSNSKQGRCYVKKNCKIELSLQDNNKTLKIFLNDK